MNVEVRRPVDFKTTKWSGGTTTELYLSPAEGDYAARNFDVRISSAEVLDETSEFTKLPGIERWLMVLEGEMDLEHAGQKPVKMQPYDINHFHGDWETKSTGCVRDFNLMIKGETTGEMTCQLLVAGKTQAYKSRRKQHCAFYILEGAAKVGGETVKVGELAIVDFEERETLEVTNDGSQTLKMAVCRWPVNSEA